VLRQPNGLTVFLLLACLAGCRSGSEAPLANAGDRDAGPPPGDPDATTPADAALEAGPERGDTPQWPEAEQEVELPYGGSAQTRLLVVEARPGALDLHLNVDTTASIRFAIDELQGALRTDVVRRLAARTKDIAFGVSRYADFPRTPFGRETARADRAFVLLTAISTDLERVIAAVNQLDRPLDQGGDIQEASAEALYQVATGAGYTSERVALIEPWSRVIAPGGGSLGGVGFRSFALRVVLHVADAPTHQPAEYADAGLAGTRSLAEATAALRELGARVVAIMPTNCNEDACRQQWAYGLTRLELSRLAVATGAVTTPQRERCSTGIAGGSLPVFEETCPLVFDTRGDGSGLSRTLSDGVLALLDELRFGAVQAEPSFDRLELVQGLRAEQVPQADDRAAPELSDRLPNAGPDGIMDTHVQVGRDARVGFRVTLQNRVIAPAAVPQRFRVAVRVSGDGILLEERFLRVVVPAASDMGEAGTSGKPPSDASAEDDGGD